MVRGQRLCVPCGDQDAAYWKETALSAQARAAREETEHLKTMAELNEADVTVIEMKKKIRAVLALDWNNHGPAGAYKMLLDIVGDTTNPGLVR